MSTNKMLYDFCRWNDTKKVQELLDLSDDIDILYDNGGFFDFAISKGNVEICKSLLNYFETKQFPTKNTEYQEAREKLVEILENATDSVELSPEIKEVLSPYIDFKASEQDLSTITEVSNENASSIKNDEQDLSVKNVKFPYSLSTKIKNILMDICFDTDILSPKKKHYTNDFKINVQNLLKVQKLQEVLDFLEDLKDPYSLERIPSKSTMYRWKKEISKEDFTFESLQKLEEELYGKEIINILQNQENLDSFDNKENDINLNTANLSHLETNITQQNDTKIVGEDVFLDINHDL